MRFEEDEWAVSNVFGSQNGRRDYQPLTSQRGFEQADLGFRLRVDTTRTGEEWLSLPHDAAIRRDGFLPPGYRQELLFQEDLAAYANPILICGADCETLKDIPHLESRTRPGELDRWLAACGVRKTNGMRQSFGYFYTAYGIVSIAAVMAWASLRPAAVIADSRPPLENSGVFSHCSSARSCLATAPSVTFSSAAAVCLDPRRAVASNKPASAAVVCDPERCLTSLDATVRAREFRAAFGGKKSLALAQLRARRETKES